MGALLYQWMGLLWIPVALALVRKFQRLKTAIFIFTCIMSLQIQVELMESLGYPHGMTGLLKWGVYERGLVVYSIVFVLFLLLAHYSPNTRGIIFFAACLSIYIFSFCASMLIMVL